MTDLNYGKYILKGTVKEKPDAGKEPAVSATLEGLKDWGGIQHRISWKYVTQPTLLMEEPHTHDFDEFLIFLGSNPKDPKDFGAEIELSLGQEQETQIINTASVVCVPKGLIHGPLNFRKIGNSIMFAIIYLAPEYNRKPLPGGDLSPAKTSGAKYGKYVLRESKGKTPRKLESEEWGASINEDITSGIGRFDCNFNFLGILGPHMLPDPPHNHNCGEFLFLIPSTYEDWPNLGGEVEIAIGEEWEKHTITTAAVICLPEGLHHCPVYMKNIDKPFYWGHVLPAPSYDSSEYDPEQIP